LILKKQKLLPLTSKIKEDTFVVFIGVMQNKKFRNMHYRLRKTQFNAIFEHVLYDLHKTFSLKLVVDVQDAK